MKTLDIIWLFVYVKSPGLLYASQIHQQGLWDATAINLSFNDSVCRWSKLCICEFIFSASISMQWLTVPVLHWLIRRVIPVYGFFFTKPLITSYSSKWDTGVKSSLLKTLRSASITAFKIACTIAIPPTMVAMLANLSPLSLPLNPAWPDMNMKVAHCSLICIQQLALAIQWLCWQPWATLNFWVRAPVLEW